MRLEVTVDSLRAYFFIVFYIWKIQGYTYFIVGKYMQMMNVLKPIAFDVVICVSQLFDYYLFAVSNVFIYLIEERERLLIYVFC